MPAAPMMITSRQSMLVRQTWSMVAPISTQAAALFYGRLFTLDPSLRSLFAHSDMAAQGEKLMQMLGVAVAQLDKLDTLVPAVVALGRRHTGYGVQAQHYETVGAALLWTLQQGLGDAFTPEVRDAWSTTYGVLVGAMLSPHTETVQAVA